MYDCIKWFLDSRLTDWLSAGGSIASGFVAYKIYVLDKKISEGDSPQVNIWFDNSYQTFDGILGEITLINLGKEKLPIREITFIYDNPEKRIHSALSTKVLTSTAIKNDDNYLESQSDLILESTRIVKLKLLCKSDYPAQFTIRAMYYDNSFELIRIDTSNSGGKYILKGKGRKY